MLKIEQYVINKVREMRSKKGISQAELADLIDVTAGFIGKVESPKHSAKYNLNHIQKLAEVFKCSPQEFLPKTYHNSKDD